MPRDRSERPLADNRKAGHDYHLLEQFEAGLALLGTEVKAIREGRVQLRDSYCKLDRGEAYLLGAHIGQYSHGGYASHDPTRPRKLLLHRDELNKLLGKTTERGLTIVPLRMYLKNGRVKLAIALAKGKKTYDKRETIRRRDAERETRAAIKTRQV
ncbi:MAG TPA: SsrA-binding protein SmpB [Vicinamibacterales bacterium]|nr:SsrA-binding protein SmpB [Vicinamibacterales bacterium]